jgi:hypothetical protein
MEAATETAAAEAAATETAAEAAATKTAATESAAAESATGICRSRHKGTERSHRGDGNHRFTQHDNLLHNVRGDKRCRRRIVAPRQAKQDLNSAKVPHLDRHQRIRTPLLARLRQRGIELRQRAHRRLQRQCPEPRHALLPASLAVQ